MIKDSLNIPHITSGGLFRAMKSQDTPLARRVQAIINRGDLVPDDITIQIVRERITKDDAKKGFILDGFPRTEPQARALDALMAELGQHLTAVVFLNISDEEAIDRVSGRLQCELNEKHIYHVTNCPPKVSGICDYDSGKLIQREDDTPESVQKRIDAYHLKTQPLLDYYANRGLLLEIDAARPVEQIMVTVLEELNKVTTKS